MTEKKVAPTWTHLVGRQRLLTGVKPTGDLHLGNYFGAMLPCIEASRRADAEVILFCADWHGLTDRSRMLEPGKQTVPILAAFVVMGFQTQNHSMILQSHFRQIQEVAWFLSCASAVGLLERAHAYKDAVQAGKKPTAGLFYYPILMAADIVTFDTQVVPVGQDQAQHLEYTSDMAKLFNNAVEREVFLEPKPLQQKMALLPGTDGVRKMSKSYDNYVPLFAPKKEVETRVKGIKTDSLGLNDPKDPDSCAVFQILRSFGSPESIADMRERLQRGTGYGYGHAKLDLIAEHERVFGSKREEFEHYVKAPKELWKLMEPGHERATRYADCVATRAREALGLLNFN